MKQLVFDKVKKVYKKNIVALEDVSFDVLLGEFLFITGHSGAGKSTLLRLLIKEDVPTAGNIVFENIEVPTIPNILLPQFRKQIGVVFQDLMLIKNKTAIENIEFVLEIVGTPSKKKKETTEYLLELVGMQDRKDLFPHQLSGGEKQKIAIARAIANMPSLLVADEPTGNLDPESSGEILEILRKINQAGTTVIVITHNFDLIADERVLELKKGKIVKDSGERDLPEDVQQQLKGKTPITILDIPQNIVQTLSLHDYMFVEHILDLTPKELSEIGLKKKDVKKLSNALKVYLLNQNQDE